MANSVNIPGGGSGMQGLRTGQASDDYYCPLDSKGSSIKTGGEDRTRITGGLGHAQTSSKTNSAPSSYYSNTNRSQDA